MDNNQDIQPLPVALSRLRLRHFQAFDALKRLGSLRRVAAELGLSQSATVALINDLEHAFKIALVKRERNGTTLTADAEMLIAHSKIILQEVELIQRHALKSKKSSGIIRIGASPYLISFFIPHVLALFKNINPNVYVDIQEDTLDNLLKKLVDGEIDAVIGNFDNNKRPSPDAELVHTFLWKESISIIAGKGHPLFSCAGASLEEILDGPWILPQKESHIRYLVDRAISNLKAPPLDPMVECRGILNLLNLAAATGSLSVAPTAEINQILWQDRVKLVPCPLTIDIPPYSFITRRYKKPLSILQDMQQCANDAVTLLGGGEGS